MKTKKDRRTYRTIVSTEEVESVPTKCIEVDSPSSTFLCGKSLLVTHNTNKPKNFEVHQYTEDMLYPFSEYKDTSLAHYMIQLPLYARLLLDMLQGTKYSHVKFLGCVIVHLEVDGNMTEYRIPKKFTDVVMTMDPLPRIEHVKEFKKLQEYKELERLRKLDILIHGYN
jgi:hypothetical protein